MNTQATKSNEQKISELGRKLAGSLAQVKQNADMKVEAERDIERLEQMLAEKKKLFKHYCKMEAIARTNVFVITEQLRDAISEDE